MYLERRPPPALHDVAENSVFSSKIERNYVSVNFVSQRSSEVIASSSANRL